MASTLLPEQEKNKIYCRCFLVITADIVIVYYFPHTILLFVDPYNGTLT